MWAPRAAVEPGVDARPLERVLDQAQVFARRAQEDRDLVEAHAAAHLVENAPRDLDALASLAWRREEPDVALRLALSRLARGEERATQRRQVRISRRNEGLDRSAQRFEIRERSEVAEGNRDQGLWRRRDELLRQAELDGGFHRHVEEEKGQASHSANALAGSGEERGPAGSRCGGKLLVESLEEPRQVGAAERKVPQGRRLDAGHREIVERPGQRPREAGRAGDVTKVGEPAILAGIERSPRGDRLRADERRRCDPASRKHRRCETGRQLREAEPVQASRRPASERDRSGQIVGGAAGGRDDERAAIGARRQPALGRAQACRGFGTLNDVQGRRGRHGTHLPGRRAGSPRRPRHAAVGQTVTEGCRGFKGFRGFRGFGVQGSRRRIVAPRNVRGIGSVSADSANDAVTALTPAFTSLAGSVISHRAPGRGRTRPRSRR